VDCLEIKSPFALSKTIEKQISQKLALQRKRAIFISGDTDADVAPKENPW
tara:strand:- start:9 stop:158 length:150 start_codon:yes stop_codon:yes gene_type:complete